MLNTSTHFLKELNILIDEVGSSLNPSGCLCKFKEIPSRITRMGHIDGQPEKNIQKHKTLKGVQIVSDHNIGTYPTFCTR